MYDVPYDSAFKEGTGFYASSGVKALSMKAFQKFVLPTSQTGAYLPVVAHLKTEEIITEEEHNRERELQDMSSFALYKNALGDREMTATNVRLAQLSKNVTINYDVREHEPRIVDVNTVQLYSGAMSLLKRSYKDFREEYGDYFMAGYTWGMRFREIPAAKEFIPALLPISRNHFNAIIEMNRTIFRTRCSYNALLSIPVTNFTVKTE